MSAVRLRRAIRMTTNRLRVLLFHLYRFVNQYQCYILTDEFSSMKIRHSENRNQGFDFESITERQSKTKHILQLDK